MVRVEVVRDTTVGTAVAAATAVFDRHLCLTTWMQSSEIVFLRTSVTRSPECRGFRLLLVPAVLAGITLPRNHPRSPFCIASVADALVTSAGVKVILVDVPGTSCTRSLVVGVTTLHQLVIRSLAVKRIITGVLGRDALVVCFCVEVFAVGVRATRDVWTLFVDARSCCMWLTMALHGLSCGEVSWHSMMHMPQASSTSHPRKLCQLTSHDHCCSRRTARPFRRSNLGWRPSCPGTPRIVVFGPSISLVSVTFLH